MTQSTAVAHITNDPVNSQGVVIKDLPKKSDDGAPDLPAYNTAEDFKAAQPQSKPDDMAGDATALVGDAGKKDSGCCGQNQSCAGSGCA